MSRVLLWIAVTAIPLAVVFLAVHYLTAVVTSPLTVTP